MVDIQKGRDILGGDKLMELPDWFEMEMPISKLPMFSAVLSTVVGALVGISASLVVNCALVEISTSPFFTMYFGVTFFIIGLVILWRLKVSLVDRNSRERLFLRVFGLMIIASGIICLCLQRNWFIHFPRLIKIFIYTLVGISISFALTFTIVDLVNYVISMFETSVARPLVESRSQVNLILAIALAMGGFFGFAFGIMDIDDEVEYHIKLALIKEESYTWPIGMVLGSLVCLN
ncbi:hypothetical protein BdWA1_000156 [Babesia duncani]|uniref:Uncharacterized protein n=1 Tax=Babesia duncani TaxID=323732 RepID=A0AAD9UPR7_9APIC|nr:hypothetical protein BdWA1_000156 [Babesia duncani]